MTRKYCTIICFILMLVTQLLIIVHFAEQKSGYDIDEIFSYGLANNNYGPTYNDIPQYYNHWHSSEVYKNYVTVQKNERFQYGFVYHNQQLDVHPPLYYLLLHTVSSFFPNVFSKWIGLSLNFAGWVIMQILLYLISRNVFKNYWLALLPCFFWGFSAAAISLTLFIRMYALLTCLTLLVTLIAFHVISHKKISLGLSLTLFLTVLVGFLTQYYFLIYLFFLSFAIAFILLIKKRWMNLLKCATCVILSIASGLLIFPSAIHQILLNQRGQQTRANFFDISIFKQHLTQFNALTNSQLYGGFLKPLVVFLLFSILIWLITHFFITRKVRFNREKQALSITTTRLTQNEIVSSLNQRIINFFILLFTSIGYYLVVIKISPYQVGRYVYPIFPQLALLTIYSLSLGIYVFCRNTRMVAGVLIILSIFTSLFGIGGKHIEIMNTYDKQITVAPQYFKDDCLLVGLNKNVSKTNSIILQLLKYRRILPTSDRHLDHISQAVLKPKGLTSSVIIYVNKDVDTQIVINKVIKATSFNSMVKLPDTRFFHVYKISRE
ncbi:MAG: hypothetical protein LKI80_08930 [Sporolactobacillus sp.]|nr:hypothetical protein [Sporolactobacillus sp.]